MHSEQAIRCVEVLCERGCAAVRAVIAAMEGGHIPVETEGLTESQRKFVLEELQAIMSVYDRPCPVPASTPPEYQAPAHYGYAASALA